MIINIKTNWKHEQTHPQPNNADRIVPEPITLSMGRSASYQPVFRLIIAAVVKLTIRRYWKRIGKQSGNLLEEIDASALNRSIPDDIGSTDRDRSDGHYRDNRDKHHHHLPRIGEHDRLDATLQ